MNKFMKLVVIVETTLLMILFVLFMPGELIEQPNVRKYVEYNQNNLTTFNPPDYPEEWKCVNITNYFMENNPEWGTGCIFMIGDPIGHAFNYQVKNDILYIHDDTWGWEYELKEWRKMNIILNKEGVRCERKPGNVPMDSIYFYPNIFNE